MAVVAGIDVGGRRKGFHAVALEGKRILDVFKDPDASTMASWCASLDVAVVAIDAPCKWSHGASTRDAERCLKKLGIGCFSTPTESAARAHPTNHYGWMLAGESLFNALASTYQLFEGQPRTDIKYCLETFPHAVVWSLERKIVSAKNKGIVRREVLRKFGIETSRLSSIDFVDAALCAVAALSFRLASFQTFGAEVDGLIVLPDFGVEAHTI
jgi:predicted nuclease with RNAse H fold